MPDAMDLTEAFARLGLETTATRDEIDAAWRQAMKAVHPDTGTAPDGNLAVVLNQARATALSAVAVPSTELVPLAAVMELVKAQQPAQMERAARASDQALKSVVMHHVGGLAYRKRQRAILASIGAFVTVVLTLLAAVNRIVPEDSQAFYGFLAAFAAVLTALVGLGAWRLSAQERTLNLDLEEAAETLSDRAAYLDTIDEIGLGAVWTRQELHAALQGWEVPEVRNSTHGPSLGFFGPPYRSVPLAHTAAEIGHVDFGRLLVAKGIELDLVQEDAFVREDGRTSYGFRRK
jgi:hypothetical protein